jgi:hypothetical protein
LVEQDRGWEGGNRGQNANDHEQQARVHPAQPSYSVVAPAPELLSIDVAVKGDLGMIGTFRKGRVVRKTVNRRLLGHLSDHGPSDDRRRNRLRLRRLNLLNRLFRLSGSSWRRVHERHDQGGRPDNGA